MPDIWTIGHWTRPESTFVALLREHDIEVLADVRIHPGSRTSPQFAGDLMPTWLEPTGITYAHLEDLGGRRRAQDVDPELNSGWHNTSFKNYADYTLKPAYQHAIAHLIELAADRRVVIMCAEAMPWRCHRLLIANTLTARGWTVRHVIDDAGPLVHELGRWGATPTVGSGGRVTYPEAPGHAR
ncbi:MAG: DUF488 domain-containing protein [Candidatus Nanopelagicales bacterium]